MLLVCSAMQRKIDHPDYELWRGMRRRCSDPKTKDYYRYGGRGVRYCERWRDFWNFVADMGPRPSSQHTLDRIDNEQGYSPDNCRWATKLEQQHNRRCTIPVEVNGVSYPSIRIACEMLGVSYETMARRIRLGMSPQEAFGTPVKRYKYPASSSRGQRIGCPAPNPPSPPAHTEPGHAA
jgi:hypothetical protein